MIKVSVLSENTSLSPDIGCEHGLSLFIETDGCNILFDTGASCLFKDNAVKMGLDIAQADMAVISHGHYDHGGGLCGFLNFNDKAEIYVSPYAFADYRARRENGELEYAGLDIKFAFNKRLHPVYEKLEITPEIMIFSDVKGDYPRPSGNDCLFVYSEGTLVPDDFRHEQNLVIRDANGITLVAGCAHSGIVNILERCRELVGAYPNTVLGGFHLYNYSAEKSEDPQKVALLAQRLLDTGAAFYTGHCTGPVAYQQLCQLMGDKIAYMSAGSRFSI